MILLCIQPISYFLFLLYDTNYISATGGGCGDDRASLCQRCRPSDGVGSGQRVYPSRPVMRPDSSTSSIRRLCRNRYWEAMVVCLLQHGFVLVEK